LDSRCFNRSARLAARLGRDPAVACFAGGAGGGAGFPAVLPAGRVDGVGGGTFRPVVGFGPGGFGALDTPPLATGGFGADTTVGPFGNEGLFAVGLVARTALGVGRNAGAGGGAGGVGFGASISSLR